MSLLCSSLANFLLQVGGNFGPYLLLFCKKFDFTARVNSFWFSRLFCWIFYVSIFGFSSGGSLLAVVSRWGWMNAVQTDQRYIVQELKVQWGGTKSRRDPELKELKAGEKPETSSLFNEASFRLLLAFYGLCANTFSSKVSRNPTLYANCFILFVLVCAALFLFYWTAYDRYAAC